MENRVNFRNILFILSGLILLCFFSSCVNLPGKEKNLSPDTGISENQNEDTDQVSRTGEQSAQNYIPDQWTTPEAGPTVTPVVLMIQKRGESEDMIIRSDTAFDQEIYTYDSNENTLPEIETRQIPTASSSSAVSGGMKDEMQVVSFAPFSGSVVLPNQALHLDIMLKNTGTTTWQTNYKVVDYSNMAMTVQHEYNLPYAVAPGSTVLLSIYMTSPANLGSYPANFQIQDSYGVVFGQFDYVLTVGAFSSITEIPTLTPSVTPTYYSASGITATPDSLAWMCIDPERSKLQDCYQFCVEYSHRDEFKYCFYNGELYKTPVPQE